MITDILSICGALAAFVPPAADPYGASPHLPAIHRRLAVTASRMRRHADCRQQPSTNGWGILLDGTYTATKKKRLYAA